MRILCSGFAKTIEEFLSYRNILGYTSEAYRYFLGDFDRFCENYYPELTILEKDVIFHWLDDVSQNAHNALSKKATAIRQYGKYLVSTGRQGFILPNNYVSHKSTFTPYIFTDNELTRLFHAIDSIKIVARRDKYAPKVLPVLFRLIYTCGLRPNEGRNLECCNVNLDTGDILITQTKRHKERIVVMSDDMLALCRQYKLWKTSEDINSKYFFPRSNGLPYDHECLCKNLRHCWEMANSQTPKHLLPRIRPYDLRHRYASAILHKWLDEGWDLYAMLPYLRAYMGHELPSSTTYYIHILPENLVHSRGVNWEKLEQIIPEVTV